MQHHQARVCFFRVRLPGCTAGLLRRAQQPNSTRVVILPKRKPNSGIPANGGARPPRYQGGWGCTSPAAHSGATASTSSHLAALRRAATMQPSCTTHCMAHCPPSCHRDTHQAPNSTTTTATEPPPVSELRSGHSSGTGGGVGARRTRHVRTALISDLFSSSNTIVRWCTVAGLAWS